MKNNSLMLIKETFIKQAKCLGVRFEEDDTEKKNPIYLYSEMTPAQLGDGYCKAEIAEDKELMNCYYAAIMLRYWSAIIKWNDTCKSLHLDITDYVSWLNDCVQDALFYKSWLKYNYDGTENPKALLKPDGTVDPNAFDKSMHNFIGFKRAKEYQASNKHKRKSNAINYSIDSFQDENGDCALDYAGCTTEDDYGTGIQSLVLKFLQEGKSIEALILDGIAYQDSFKEEKKSNYRTEVDEESGEETQEKYYTYSSTFDPRRLVKHLNSIDENFMQRYFKTTYKLEDEQVETILTKLKGLNNTKLYNYIKKTIDNIKNNREYLSYIVSK